MSGRRRWLWLWGTLGSLAIMWPSAGVQAQDGPVETTARPDSLREAILDRARVRTTPTVEVVEDDTVETEEATAQPVRRSRAESPAQADSLMQALLELEQFNSASYQGRRADFSAADRRLVLWGEEASPARFSGEGVQLDADSSITYEDLSGRVRTTGSAVLTPEEGEPLRSRALIYDLREERGTASGAQTTYTEGARWIVSGELDSVQSGLLFGSNTRFTSCDADPPHSFFEADRIKILAGQVLVASSVKMYVEDVPVLWLPFIAQSLGEDRSSGLLTPTFSVNEIVRASSGYNRRVSNLGFYWAMSSYSDMTVAMDWFSNRYTALELGTRYRWSRQFLDGSLNMRQYWRDGGGRELGMDTRHSWQYSERTSFRASGRFVSSADFVREHSFDPREINQTVDSDASLSHRFNWGNLTLGASRRQYLNEERTEMTLPSGGLSLSTLTLFAAPPQSARWYNNLAVTGSTNWNRRVSDWGPQPDTAFSFQRAPQVRTQGTARTSLSLGDLSLSGNLQVTEALIRDVPGSLFPTPGPNGMNGFLSPLEVSPLDPTAQAGLVGDRADLSSGEATWSASLSYRQRLIGATTLSPNVSLQGRMLRVDTIPEARDYVQGPVRVGVGATLQTEIYGFFPGFAQFDAIRHKITPNVNWSYAPEIEPTDLQTRVFGARLSRRQNGLSFGFNQTWEARVSADEDDGPGANGVIENGAADEEVSEQVPIAHQNGNGNGDINGNGFDPGGTNDGEPRRLPRSEVVTLLALQTSAISYDIVEADSTGRFVDGFTTTTLSNTVSSDYLRGLSLSFSHDLFDDSDRMEEGGRRLFQPHLSQMSLGFSLDDQSGPVRFLGRLLGIAPPERPPETQPEEEPQEGEGPDGAPLEPASGFDQNRMIPGAQDTDDVGPVGAGWDARIQYSLRRPRGTGIGSGSRAQMLQTALSFAPSPNWDMTWSTSYDLEMNRFNDHVVRLRRDLHEWEASFGFRQTATGNWSFQFDVSLKANPDLRFDYHQRSF